MFDQKKFWRNPEKPPKHIRANSRNTFVQFHETTSFAPWPSTMVKAIYLVLFSLFVGQISCNNTKFYGYYSDNGGLFVVDFDVGSKFCELIRN